MLAPTVEVGLQIRWLEVEDIAELFQLPRVEYGADGIPMAEVFELLGAANCGLGVMLHSRRFPSTSSVAGWLMPVQPPALGTVTSSP